MSKREKKSSPSKKDKTKTALAGENVTQIDSNGGDIALGGSRIDKRSGGFYVGLEPEDRQAREPPSSWNTSTRVALGAVIAAVLSLLSNIIAAYLQQRYDLVDNTDRLLVVLLVFFAALFVSIGLAVKSRDN